jgi:hypothetical protein
MTRATGHTGTKSRRPSLCIKQPVIICVREVFGRATAEAVSRWLPIAAARVRARFWQIGFVVDKVESGQVFYEYFGFPYQNSSFHQLFRHHNHPGHLAEALR